MKYTIQESLSPRMTITARPGLGGQWLVEFQRWHPIGARLVTPALLEQVESWLRGRAHG